MFLRFERAQAGAMNPAQEGTFMLTVLPANVKDPVDEVGDRALIC